MDQQKKAIKKEYARAGYETGGEKRVRNTVFTRRAARRKRRKQNRFKTAGKRRVIAVVTVVFALIIVFSSTVSSCSVMFQGLSSTVNAATYPLEDEDMLAAEAAYCEMEEELRIKLETYQETHDYDEYHFDLDEIKHDPYVLISAITALQGGEWTIDEIKGSLETLFEKQYILTEDMVSETRYRTETRTGTKLVYDSSAREYREAEYNYTVQVPYEYRICTVTLENFNLSHVPVYIMSHDQLSMYAMYMDSLGNRPDLFPESDYVRRYYGTEYEKYKIPEEALADERFALMIKEAEKYLGFPYVWGGSDPSTSFDCSGFVSWVCNNCGYGWDFGREGAEGLYYMCSPVSAGSVRPGDLVFFIGTYDTDFISHVGIYVGNGMMIHCGDPIQYADLNGSYWQAHFYSYGRLPEP